MRARAGVAACIFDWGGTLTPWHTVDIREQWSQTYAAHAYPNDAAGAAAFTEALLAAEEQVWALSRQDHRSARIGEVVQQACAAVGLDVGRLDPTTVGRLYEDWWAPHTLTDPQVLPLWSWLRSERISVGVLSNTLWSRDYHRGLFARDGVLDLIDGDVYTSEIEVVKPHPDAFVAAATAVGAAPEHCVYVGDRLYEDVHGPQQVGMRAIHIPHSLIPTSQHVQVDATPDAVALQLADIAGIVHGWQREMMRA